MESIKYASEVLKNPLSTQIHPSLGKMLLFVIITFEKGDYVDLRNYRPINFSSHVYKLFPEIQAKWINHKTEDAQTTDEAGFVSGRSTNDPPIHTMNLLLAIQREFNTTISITFLDHEKAFDSVEKQAIINAVTEEKDCPQNFGLVENIYSSATFTIQLHTEDSEFLIIRCVPQGDSMFPKLFIKCMHSFFDKLQWKRKSTVCKLDKNTSIIYVFAN